MLIVPYNFITLLSNGKNKKHSAKQKKKKNSQREELKEKNNKGDKNSIICRFSLTYDGVLSRWTHQKLSIS